MINLTVIFDSNYVEPALLTALDLERFLPVNWDMTLIFIESDDNNVNSEIFSLLGEYLTGKRIKAISLQSDLFEIFDKYHFNNSILYKLILPEITHGSYILNVDAGFLSGSKISILFEYCVSLINSAHFAYSPIAAVCSSAEQDLPVELRSYHHNPMYPVGWLFLFNRAAYKKSEFFTRVMSGYKFFKDKLIWAEQDLLCLVTNYGEITSLNIQEHMLIEQLSLQGFILNEKSQAFGSEFMLYKITGTLKPWKLWVFDNKKQFYLSRRSELIDDAGLEKFQVVKYNWYHITHHPIYQAFLSLYQKKQKEGV